MSVLVTYLEMTHPGALRPARPLPEVPVAPVRDPDLNRDLYAEIGAPYGWTDRLGWPPARWARYLAGVETLVARVEGAPAGYAELEAQPGGDVELAIFGVLPRHQGRGIGGHLLTEALRRAWALHPRGTRRVWVHTCSLDGPHALANYEARGLVVFRRRELP